MSRNIFWNNFWSAYATVYDSISQLTPYRKLVSDVCDPVGKAALIFDAGCGTGNLCRYLERQDDTRCVVGLDRSPFMLRQARQKLSRSVLVRGSLDSAIPFRDARFDAIVCCNVIYSVADPGATLREFRRVIVSGGLLVCANPKEGLSLRSLIAGHFTSGRGSVGIFMRHLPGIAAATLFNLFLLSRTDWTKFHFPPLETLEEVLRQAGFAIERSRTTYADQDWLIVARAV